MAQPPGSEFGTDFFKFVLGPVGDTLIGFGQQALPTPSGIGGHVQDFFPQSLPTLGVPGLTTPGYGGGGVPGAGPDTYRGGVPGSETVDPLWGKLLAVQRAEMAKVQDAQKSTAAAAGPAGSYVAPSNTGYAANVQRFSSQIKQAAADTGVPERVLAAIVHVECPNCDPSTVRRDTYATGLGQVVHGPTDPLENLRAAGNLLREKQQIFGIGPDDWVNTAAAYFGAYNPKRGGVTADTDPTGTTGFVYVDKFKNAYNTYPDNLDAITRPPTQTPAAVASVSGGVYPTVNNSVSAARPSQFDPWLTTDEQYAACGPAVVAGLSGMSVREATDMASKNGWWSVTTGMASGGAESLALTKAGVPNTYVPTINQQQAINHVESGLPVVFSMAYVNDSQPGHYFLADAYDPGTNRWHVGTSGTDLKVSKDWMTLSEMARLGPPQSMILVEGKGA